ncbi:MAG: nitrogen regulation protein NR(II) [Advenella sp.]|uniref:nitrogen regulation protein NR(II) n=1 Tax=Advenella sp. TaxID=1872388 RepID=UPI002582BC3E|nr:nitrogen regulation protein NR(II) [Advenella sp.]MDD3757883.1 nitrogen regulation protein NR(II) [Advenella sp.]
MNKNGSFPVTLQDCKALDLLATTVFMLDQDGLIRWVNNAGQHLLKRSSRSLEGMAVKNLFEDVRAFEHAFEAILHGEFSSFGLMGCIIQNLGQEKLLVSATMQRLEQQAWSVILEVREIEQHTLAERNERLIKELEIHQETFRNLGHEVKNPLGGLRGAAQLLEMELSDPALQEYTRVIIAEADRLQELVDRLIRPGQTNLNLSLINIHEVCERVHALLKAEYRDQITIARDYDASVPDMNADMAKLLQAYLNIGKNAAQSLLSSNIKDSPRITLRTRVLNRHLLLNKMHRLVVVVSVIDNGAGVPEALHDRVFHPLVTGRPDGTGLGLSLAQEYVRQHGGLIEFDSVPGRTEFRILLPLDAT